MHVIMPIVAEVTMCWAILFIVVAGLLVLATARAYRGARWR